MSHPGDVRDHQVAPLPSRGLSDPHDAVKASVSVRARTPTGVALVSAPGSTCLRGSGMVLVRLSVRAALIVLAATIGYLAYLHASGNFHEVAPGKV